MPVPSGALLSDEGEIPAAYAYFLLPSSSVVTETSRVKRILNYIEARFNPPDTPHWISKLRAWVSDNLAYQEPPRSWRDSEEVLKDGYGDYTNVFLALARSARIPAKRVYGWIIPKGSMRMSCHDSKAIAGHTWAQVYLPAKGWVSVDPQAKTDKVPYRVCAGMEETWQQALAAYEAVKGIL
jgi:transglutaminase-like putative cysteine protease